MDKNPIFSIIIPTYNRAKALRRALASIEKQSFKDFEVIICDDGSTDHTKQVIDAFSGKFDITYLWQEHWGGPARARNQGLRAAHGDFIAFLDSDDWWYPNKLEVAKKYLHNADIVYHDLDIYTEKGKSFFKRVKGRRLKKPVFVDLMKNENALINSSVVVKRGIADQVGPLSEDKSIISLEDFDFWLRISRITDKFLYIPLTLGAYWLGSGCISQASKEKLKRIEAAYNKHLDCLTQKDKLQARMLMSYLLGRTKQKIGLREEALGLFKISAGSENRKIRFRSACWILYLSVICMLAKKPAHKT